MIMTTETSNSSSAPTMTAQPRTLPLLTNGGNGSSLAIADDGFARISYYDDTNGELEFVQCTNDDCSTNSTTTVDSTGGVFGEYTSLAIGSDGFARISYFEYDYVGQNANLKFARFTNDISFNPDGNDLFVAGSLGVEGNITTDGSLLVNQSAKIGNSVLIGQIFKHPHYLHFFLAEDTVDSSGDVGYYNSLAIADDGFARISYYDGTNEDLKFVQCTNADCSTNSTTTVDSTGGVFGECTSLAIANDGFARISYIYWDEVEDVYNLKFVQCTNDDCYNQQRYHC